MKPGNDTPEFHNVVSTGSTGITIHVNKDSHFPESTLQIWPWVCTLRSHKERENNKTNSQTIMVAVVDLVFIK